MLCTEYSAENLSQRKLEILQTYFTSSPALKSSGMGWGGWWWQITKCETSRVLYCFKMGHNILFFKIRCVPTLPTMSNLFPGTLALQIFKTQQQMTSRQTAFALLKILPTSCSDSFSTNPPSSPET